MKFNILANQNIKYLTSVSSCPFIMQTVFVGQRRLHEKISTETHRHTSDRNPLAHDLNGLLWQIKVNCVLTGPNINAHWTTGF